MVTPTSPGNAVDSRPTASAAAPGTVSANNSLFAPLTVTTEAAKIEPKTLPVPVTTAHTMQRGAEKPVSASAAQSDTAEKSVDGMSAPQASSVLETLGAAKAVQTGDTLARLQTIGDPVPARPENTAQSGTSGKAEPVQNAVTGHIMPTQAAKAAAPLPSAFGTPTANAADVNFPPSPFDAAVPNAASNVTFNLAALANEAVTSTKGETAATSKPVSSTAGTATHAVMQDKRKYSRFTFRNEREHGAGQQQQRFAHGIQRQNRSDCGGIGR